MRPVRGLLLPVQSNFNNRVQELLNLLRVQHNNYMRTRVLGRWVVAGVVKFGFGGY